MYTEKHEENFKNDKQIWKKMFFINSLGLFLSHHFQAIILLHLTDR
jgi:hypothetical protein